MPVQEFEFFLQSVQWMNLATLFTGTWTANLLKVLVKSDLIGLKFLTLKNLTALIRILEIHCSLVVVLLLNLDFL